MKRVSLLAFESTIASTVTGPMDVFNFAGLFWNFIFNKTPTLCFQSELVSSSDQPITCLGNVVLKPSRAFIDIETTDLIVISAIADIDDVIQKHPTVFDWLRERYKEGAHIASVCTGAYILAETGLLNGKTASTHWGFADHFSERYPEVRITPERLITDEGDLFCSGGVNSAIDLSLYLVEKYYGHELSLQCSKALVSDFKRISQTAYSAFQFQKEHKDKGILRVQEWLEDNINQRFDFADLASKYGMSRRTFERRFKIATGDTPLNYLQRLRVEMAKRLLESELDTIEEISYKVGYEDTGFFRKIFERHTGLSPKGYRRRFGRYN